MNAISIYNFLPGPSILPLTVKELLKEAIDSYDRHGRGILEISHRSTEVREIIGDIKKDLSELLSLGEEHYITLIPGGASNQFSMLPINILGPADSADYIVSGVFAEKAYSEASRLRGARIAASSKEEKYSYIPHDLSLNANSRYLHFVSNNTIVGTQFRHEPESGGKPLVCDASSDILGRSIDISRYGLIYAGAQKNLGVAGITLVIIRNDLADIASSEPPLMQQYRTFIDHDSLYNTAPVFPIFAMGLILKWIKSQGGVPAFEELNRRKAEILYKEIDASELYLGFARKEDRSHMNVTFKLRDSRLEEDFLATAEKEGFIGLRGHRIIGGVRASMYNAFPMAGAQEFARFMHDYAERKG